MPRVFVVTVPDGLLIFDSPFDEASDDYDTDYNVYFLPWSEARRLHGSWKGLVAAVEPLGRVPVADVDFDETRRIAVSTAVVERFVKPS